ncbi:transposase [bacterium]|nr:transposase [bacterium]
MSEARIDVAEHWYHVIARGQRREDLFLDDQDRRVYLALLQKALRRNHADLGGYCLMDNHLHLLIYRRDNSLGIIFRQVHIEYAKAFNRRHRKVGYVFQGRFKSYLVLNDRYLAALVRYIHNNPVRAGMVKYAGGYRWSSDWFYRGRPSPRFMGKLDLVRVPGFESGAGRRAYLQLMAEAPGADAEFPKTGQMVGTNEEIKHANRRTRARKTWPRAERRFRMPILERIRKMMASSKVTVGLLASSSQKRSLSNPRTRLMAALYREGYPPSEIARTLKRNISTVIHASGRTSA